MSPARDYRYTLERTWKLGPKVMFVGLNPSTADEQTLDPTLRRCVRFADDWGCGGFYMTNLFAFRTKSPLEMKRALDPIGPENDEWILRCAVKSIFIVCAWGAHGSWMKRDREVYEMLRKRGYDLRALHVNADFSPKHPLYVKGDTVPKSYLGPQR